ncbi:MAG: preprotein translocase subunit YajC [Candidatus Marinimicrobia bacterium]|nr:preprotein translocase subunit YajC [Candidatus Neomarinimicrobiota bacterium]MBV67393.1 preprotein translocase subunit YajC [Candidatus Neomarinimicrobiota bacterium]|tara:strand:+ start:246 stop:533 length:288 start_codon:yes stop_codon:yes gene_type:complete
MENILASLGALPMFLLMFLVLYFLLIRPQVKEQKEREALISNLKKNDRVVTSSGIVGKVIEFQGKDNRYIIIDNENGSKIKLVKSSVSNLLERKK